MLKGKVIVLGVTGSIAAYKIATLASMLVKLNATVHVIMTDNATNFINPITFETLTNTKCLVDTFDRNFEFHVSHVSVAKQADIMMIAPASANVIGKLAGGIADDMLTTTALACKSPIFISPAMNTAMYEDSIVQENIEKLKHHGYNFIEPASGMLACRDTGKGKMPEAEELLSYIIKTIAYEKDFLGKKILVTAGPTQEAIDPVRFISNHSSGKMGYAIANAAMLRGADVTLISGKTHLKYPPFTKVIPVISAQEMFEASESAFEDQDIIIMSAAVADYAPKECADHKIKKKEADLSIELKRTKDIIGTLGNKKSDKQFLCGFAMETENMIVNAKEKLKKKHLDMIAANHLFEDGAGFETDTNILTIITEEEEEKMPLLTKEETAHQLLNCIIKNI